jgi:hypothetical protein
MREEERIMDPTRAMQELFTVLYHLSTEPSMAQAKGADYGWVMAQVGRCLVSELQERVATLDAVAGAFNALHLDSITGPALRPCPFPALRPCDEDI